MRSCNQQMFQPISWKHNPASEATEVASLATLWHVCNVFPRASVTFLTYMPNSAASVCPSWCTHVYLHMGRCVHASSSPIHFLSLPSIPFSLLCGSATGCVAMATVAHTDASVLMFWGSMSNTLFPPTHFFLNISLTILNFLPDIGSSFFTLCDKKYISQAQGHLVRCSWKLGKN